MKLIIRLLCIVSIFVAYSTLAQTPSQFENCQSLIITLEQEFDEKTYNECGFNNFETATRYWAPLAEKNKWKAALYEIYRQHGKTNPTAKTYLYKSAQLGYAPALVLTGDELFDQGKIPEAMKYYSIAMRGKLDDATKGRLTGRLAMLYADPSSTYHDTKKAIPLLKKAALQRDALSNNVLGVLSLSGASELPQNSEEAFKYFWRAALLGCPAAEENIGFLLLLKSHKIDNSLLLQETANRTYSCKAVSETNVNYPPYHFTFTPQQCADINYYAQRLVDTNLPFIGKNECSFSSDMEDMAEFLSK